MTINHPIRRFLARVCSGDTMARVVDPILADVRWESGRPTWNGYVALAKALLVHSIVSIPAVLSRTWADDGRAIPKAVALLIGGAFVASLALIAPPLLGEARGPSALPIPIVSLAVILLPQALSLTLPAALLLAIPLALRRQTPSARLARRAVALSIGCAATIFVVIAWVMPEANQAFRVMTFRAISGRQSEIPRGAAEMGFTGMRQEIEKRRGSGLYGAEAAARRLEFDYYARFMLVCLPLPLGVLALGIARSGPGRRRPWLVGLAAVAGHTAVFFPMLYQSARLMQMTSLPPVLFAWAPMVPLAMVAMHLYSSTPVLPDSSAVS
jgi:hypothetical protein